MKIKFGNKGYWMVVFFVVIVLFIVVSVALHSVTRKQSFEIQRKVYPLIRAKSKFDHLKHYSNRSLLLSGHWGTERTGERQNVWWERGTNKTPNRTEFVENLKNNIMESFQSYAGKTEIQFKDLGINISEVGEGFEINSTFQLRVSSRAGKEEGGYLPEKGGTKVTLFEEKNYTHRIPLRIFLLYKQGVKLTGDIEGLLKYDLREKLKSSTKSQETRTNKVCDSSCSAGDYPDANPTSKDETFGDLDNELAQIGGEIENSDGKKLEWYLQLDGDSSDYSTNVEESKKWNESTSTTCRCRVNNSDGNVVIWNSVDKCRKCKDGQSKCEEFLESLEAQMKCKKWYNYSYSVTPDIDCKVEDKNEDFRLLGPNGYEEKLKLRFRVKVEEITTKGPNPYQDKDVDDIF